METRIAGVFMNVADVYSRRMGTIENTNRDLAERLALLESRVLQLEKHFLQ